MIETEKLNGASLDIAAEKRAELLRLFPEAAAEGGRVDIERLRLTLGDSTEAGKERYGLSWPGKADCFKAVQSPSMATLLPLRDKSIDFDSTENLIIEGDNLEVLKLLQKSYLGKIKMIYIDPPYNTGNDFIYPDDYSESLQTYLQYTGQVDAKGRKFGTNSDTEGRFHSKWLNMMYPRLYLARNLLREDGAIFVSIDDNESHDLQLLLSEIFGAENYLVTLYIQVRFAEKTLSERNDFQKIVEQVLVYRKSDEFVPRKPTSEYTLDSFSWKIATVGDGRPEIIGGKSVRIFKPGEYEIEKVEPSVDALKETWATGSVLKANASGKFFGDYLAPRKEVDGLGALYKVEGVGEDGLGFRFFTGPKKETATKGKFYSGVPLFRRADLALGSSLKESPIVNLRDFSDAFGNCRHEGSVDFRSGKKPIAFLRWLLDMGSDGDDIILDFFAGSASMAHAVLEANEADQGNRRFILVQLPEPTDGVEFQTIADLGEERVRRVIAQLRDKEAGQITLDGNAEQDRGFRVFRLAQSNVNEWDAEIRHDVTVLEDQLALGVDHLRQGRSAADILYEVILKSGYPLSVNVDTDTIEGRPVYSVSDGAFLICLERSLTLDLVRSIAERRPERVLFLDEGFAGNDQLKTNAIQTFKAKDIVFRTL